MQFSHQQSASIKQQTMIESTLPGRFISIMARTQQHLSKDLIFELIQIFYQNNPIFLQLFEKSFLLVLQSSCISNNMKNHPDQGLKNFHDLLNGFLREMIKMEFEVTKSDQQQDYFQNFVDYFIVFFAEGLTSKKCPVKEFSFSVLVSSLKIFNQYFELDLYPQTRSQLTESIFYLLFSKLDEQKLMGIELYLLLRKINFRSVEIQTLLEQMLESTQSFKVRRTIIQHAYFLYQNDKLNSKKLNKLMQRLNDKNPLIIEEVIDKLIREKIYLDSLKFEQRIHILIQGYGSGFENVKQKSLVYFAGYLKQLFDKESASNQKFIVEDKPNALDNSYLDAVEPLNVIQKFIRIFNSDSKQVEFLSIFSTNPFISKVIFELIFSIVFEQHAISIIKTQTNKLFSKIQTSSCTTEQFIYLFSNLSRLQQASKNQNFDKILPKIIDFKRYLASEITLPNLVELSKSFRKLLKQPPNAENLTSLMFFIKTMKILTIDLDLYDFGSKKSFVDEMYKILNECEFFESEKETKPKSNENKTEMKPIKEKIIINQLLKVCSLLNQRRNEQSYEVVTCRPDLVCLIFQIIYLLNENMAPLCIDYRQTIKDLLESKQLRLQRETIIKMLKKTQHMKNSNTKQGNQCPEKNSSQEQSNANTHIAQIKQEIEKKLDKVQRKIRLNQTKGFLILGKLLSLEQQKQVKLIQASQFLDQIKAYLYYTPTNITDQKQDHVIFICYFLLYHYSLQKQENFNCFKKLFYFYAIEQYQNPQTVITKQIILRVVNFRLLFQLEMKNISRSHNLPAFNSQPQKQSVLNFIEVTFKRLQNSENTLTFEHNLYFEIALKLTFAFLKLKDSQFQSKISLYLFKLILFALESTAIDLQNFIIKSFMIHVNKLTEQLKIKMFEHILVFYRIFASFLNAKEKIKENSHFNHLILYKICKVISSFLKLVSISNQDEDNHGIGPEKQSLEGFILLSKFILKLKDFLGQIIPFVINLRLKNMFPLLFNRESRNTYVQNISEDQKFSIQLSILSRKQIENLTELIRELSGQMNLQQQRSKEIFLDQMLLMDQQLETKISNFVKCHYKQRQDEESTDNSSPLESHLSNLQLKQQQRYSSKINLQKMTQFQHRTTCQLNKIIREAENISKVMKKSGLLENFLTRFQEKYFVELNQETNNQIQELKQLESVKTNILANYSHVQKNQFISGVQILNEQSKYNMNFETERKQKSNYIECDKSVAWVKKSSLIGISFEIIENAENKLKVRNKVGKRKNQRNTKRSKGKDFHHTSMQRETDVEDSQILK